MQHGCTALGGRAAEVARRPRSDPGIAVNGRPEAWARLKGMGPVLGSSALIIGAAGEPPLSNAEGRYSKMTNFQRITHTTSPRVSRVFRLSR